MKKRSENGNMLISKLFFKLLPYQVLLLIVDAANVIVDSLFASNFIGKSAMSAIGFYSPLTHFLFALSITLVSGSQLLSGEAMGRNNTKSVNGFFSTDIIFSVIISVITSAVLIVFAGTDMTRIVIENAAERHDVNMYMIGQAFGIPALVLGQQLFAFLSMENQRRRTMTASLVCFAVNTATDFLFINVLKMGTFGLGLGSAVALWAFLAVMAQYYFAGKSRFSYSAKAFSGKNALAIVKRGYPGAISRFVEMFRCVIVNILILKYIGSSGLSAFAAVNSVMGIFWPVAFGMVAVTRMLLGISIGEEDRRSVSDIMRVAFFKGGALQCGVVVFIILMATPFTRMFYQDAADQVYQMTHLGLRMMPLCMPLAIISLNFVSYAQAIKNRFHSHVLPVVDGAVSVSVLAAILIPSMKLTGLYLANILNGFVCLSIIIGYSVYKKKHFPKNMDDVLLMPDTFGVSEKERMDMEIREMPEVMHVSRRITDFCRERNLNPRRSNFAGLTMEEMAGNIVQHGFTKDNKKHEINVRVVHKDDDIILRMRDDCVSFDPLERIKIVNESDQYRNIGIKLVNGIAKDVQYQNLLGTNVLTIRI